MSKRISCSIFIFVFFLGFTPAQPQQEPMAAVPNELVASYESLADTILGAKQTERRLILSILATTYYHAEATFNRAAAMIKSDEYASAELEKLAALVSQLGNEGDAAVAAVRKRLLEGGHHHNSAGEQQGIYDPGFVIVTKSAKKVFLAAAREIGRQNRAPRMESLQKQWDKVSSEYAKLIEESGKE